MGSLHHDLHNMLHAIKHVAALSCSTTAVLAPLKVKYSKLTALLYVQQLGVHRSASIASSGVLSNGNRANSDSSDKLVEIVTAIKEQATAPSYTERSRPSRVRSTELVPEFAPVREESSGEKSDTDICSVANDCVDRSSWSFQDLSGTAEVATTMADAVMVLPDRKITELKMSGRTDKPAGHGITKAPGRTSTAHVGFLQ